MGRSTKRPKRAAATGSDSKESTGQLAEGHGRLSSSGGVDDFPGTSWEELGILLRS